MNEQRSERIDSRVEEQIRFIISSNDLRYIQYFIPAYKLIKSFYDKDNSSVVSDKQIGLFIDTANYFVNVAMNPDSEKRLVTESALVFSQTVLSIFSSTL